MHIQMGPHMVRRALSPEPVWSARDKIHDLEKTFPLSANFIFLNCEIRGAILLLLIWEEFTDRSF